MAFHIGRSVMLRVSLFMFAALMAGIACAQVASDPQAAAPVEYSDAPSAASACDSDLRNADGSPVMSCAAQPVEDQGDAAAYPQDYWTDDASAYYAPNFYPGVSLLPYGYWAPGFAFGWPYYGFAP